MKRNSLALGLLLVLMTGCTRQVTDNAKISLSLGSLGNRSQSASAVTHIVINVRGPLMPGDIVWNWDAHQGGNIVSAPAAIYLDVPKGADRLFQILVVEENDSGSMQFLYGDTVKTLSNSTEDVSLAVDYIGSGSGTEAEVGGRYVRGDGTFPTGALDLMFQPPGTGRPAMKIFSTAMIAGWFQLFLIDGAPFSYRWVHDGTYLYNNISFNDTEFSPAGDLLYRLHVVRPAGYSYYQRDGVYVTEPRATGRVIAGFFGPGAATYAASKPVCYSVAQPMQSFYTTISHTTAMQWDPVNPTSATSAGRLNDIGGLPAADTTCSAGTAFLDRFMFDGKYAANGKDRAFGFRGVFVSPQNGSTITSTYGTNQVTLSWNLLPGVSAAIDGIAVYSHPNFSGGMETGGDGVECEKLGALGFTYIGDAAPTDTSFIIPTATEFQSTTKAALCPFKYNYAGKSKFMFTGARYENYGGGGGGGGGGPMLSFMETNGTSALTTLLVNTCHDYQVQAFSNGSPQVQTTNLTVNVSGGGGTFYSGAGCSPGNAIASTTTINSGSSSQIVSFKAASANYYSVSFSASGFSGTSTDIAVHDGANDADTLVLGQIPNPMAINRCVSGNIRLQNASLMPAVSSAATTVTLSYGGAGGGTFYSDYNCTTALPSSQLTVPALTQNMYFYFKATAISSASSMTAAAAGFTSGNMTVAIGTATATAWSFNFFTPPSYFRGTCYSFEVNPVNELGARVSLTASTTVNISTGSTLTDLEIFANGSCSGTAATSVNATVLMNEDHTQTLSFRAPTGSATGARGMDANGSSITGNKAFSVF